MDRVKELPFGYRMDNTGIKILFYADDAVLLTENEDNLPKRLQQGSQEMEQGDIEINRKQIR